MSARLLVGGALEQLAELEDGSVQTVVTSPPYWGLRDYGTAEWEGGDPGCEHSGVTRSVDGEAWHGTIAGNQPARGVTAPHRGGSPGVCRCGAVRVDEQLGLESTVGEYVARLVEIFREVRRVLRDDGTVWLNLGDTYNAYNGNRTTHGRLSGAHRGHPERPPGAGLTEPTLKNKDLCMVPARVAIALQEDGWWVRSDVIWAKPNPMPSSTKDRPTSSHEYVYLLTKAARYFYDAEAILEPFADARQGRDYPGVKRPAGWSDEPGKHDVVEFNRPESVRNVGGRTDGFTKPNAIDPSHRGGRNKRDVWVIATQAFPEAHFAVFPEKLVEPCVLAGTSAKGACPACGAPWKRVVEVEHEVTDPTNGPRSSARAQDKSMGSAGYEQRAIRHASTVGWEPTCSCGPADPRPCVVLDPFSGAGTTGKVSLELNRDFIGIELNPEYAAMAEARWADLQPTLGGWG